MAEVSWLWHSAHFPVARTSAAVGPDVSPAGRLALSTSAPTIIDVPMKMEMKTDLNVIRETPLAVFEVAFIPACGLLSRQTDHAADNGCA